MQKFKLKTILNKFHIEKQGQDKITLSVIHKRFEIWLFNSLAGGTDFHLKKHTTYRNIDLIQTEIDNCLSTHSSSCQVEPENHPVSSPLFEVLDFNDIFKELDSLI